MKKVRTRFAPSPTGRMHVGNLRTALYAYLIAKHEGGDFMLRIEDTDQERYVEGALDIIYRTLEKTGLVHDEGPDKDGGVGPYVQSERQASGIYMKYAKQLIEQGDAYYCFCDKERLGRGLLLWGEHQFLQIIIQAALGAALVDFLQADRLEPKHGIGSGILELGAHIPLLHILIGIRSKKSADSCRSQGWMVR